ncbi:DMT family transporter [Hyperthermus butylicus]|uniref:Conserved archaeal protein n=1 Tax=Hyperthermus butylicus (strain DSM 5456 / JCM 9403 / PLM1-5) TaxID=415426 RepID=A2BK94_HYPBU|nr:DMT family transporter [Hyperthermus butylicus]ABM80405.1 conserved archaeal protein [Hyperthermus butylicus DSM 5456]
MLGYAAAFTAGVLFGVSDVLVRAASARLSPLANLLLSLLIGTPLLWLTVAATNSFTADRSALLAYAVAGLLNFVVGRLLFYVSISAIGATSAAVASSPTVLFSALLAWVFLREPIDAERAAGLTAATLAVYLASSRPSGRPLHGEKLGLGVVAGIASSLVFASSTLLVRYAGGYSGGNPVLGTAVSYTVALPIAATLAAAAGRLKEITGLTRHHIFMASAAASVAFAQLLRYIALSIIEVAPAVILIGLYPLHTLLLAATILPGEAAEKPTARHAVAATLAVIAVALAA